MILANSLYLMAIVVMSIGGVVTKTLKISGAIAAIVIGCFVYLAFQWQGLLLIGSFFITSSFWSKYKSSKKQMLEQKLAKSAQRDWQQVLANGGAAAFFSLCYLFGATEVWFYAFLASICASNSDTWASEIGTLSKKQPYSLLTFKRVETGTSGAISMLGLFAGITGSFVIVLIAMLIGEVNGWGVLMLIGIAGFIGNFIDTLLGAYVQAEYKCDVCGIKTEQTFHCGQKATLQKGVAWMNNEMVNLMSSLLPGLAVGFICFYF
ncbi:DUF92 domain-containing protein [Bacillus spongiae]|uniref:DUF92 domain-containing protein n=1 Tax=Bacillus spongiae TaxID=2683610 RepID=A0ABU8H9L0_9BACI